MKRFKYLIFLLLIVNFNSKAQLERSSFEYTDTFFPGQPNQENIEWGYLYVPENWDKPEGKKIKIAVCRLKNFNNSIDPNPVVVLPGGPGASAIETVGFWAFHPLRQNSDIVLMDLRGTGWSEPRLCPDLGKEFFQIFAKNQPANIAEVEKIEASIRCKNQLVENGVDVSAYHSNSVARDLNVLKIYFDYPQWNVYAFSYGTYMAQVYADSFPEDIKSLVFDSPISNISEYYTKNTSNYLKSLTRIFEQCKSNPMCNTEYPDLEKVYYETIEILNENPISVEVDESIISSGQFTFNVEDFKIVIHQALYQEKLIELIPLLIYQFNQANEDALSVLVSAFSQSLELDFGVYYCVSCREAIPNNSFEQFEKDVNKGKDLQGGISFYKSDFAICNNWNDQNIESVKALSPTIKYNTPILIFSGGLDPITPTSNAEEILMNNKDAFTIIEPPSGHGISYSDKGINAVSRFIKNPMIDPSNGNSTSEMLIGFAEKVYLNSGVTHLGKSLNEFNLMFWFPLIIAFSISLIAIGSQIISLLRNLEQSTKGKLMKIMMACCSSLGVSLLLLFTLAVVNVSRVNFYMLAFGLPASYTYLFYLLFVYVAVIFLVTTYFLMNIKHTNHRSVKIAILFSNALIGVYFYYWGIL